MTKRQTAQALLVSVSILAMVCLFLYVGTTPDPIATSYADSDREPDYPEDDTVVLARPADATTPGGTPDVDDDVPGALIVRIVTPDQEPLVGIAVALSAGSVKIEQSSNTDGEAIFEELAPAPFRLTVAAAGEPLRECDRLVDVDSGVAQTLTIVLAPFDRSLSGRVTAPDGGAAAAAIVTAVPVYGTRRHCQLRPEEPRVWSTVTDGSGRFTLAQLQDGEYELIVEGGDDVLEARAVVRAGRDDLELRLRAARTLAVTGQISTTGGAPLGFASVAVPAARAETTSDPRGNYRVDVKVARSVDTLQIVVSRRGYATERRELTLPSDGSVAEHELDIALASLSGVRLSGSVVDANGAPLRGERVLVHSTQHDLQRQTYSRDDGSYALDDLPLGDYQIWVRARSWHRDAPKRTVTLQEGGIHRVDFGLLPLGTGVLHGTMTTIDGQPAPAVTLWAESPAAHGYKITVRSDDRGHFRMDGVPEGKLVLTGTEEQGIRVSGIRLSESESLSVNIPVDVGSQRVEGIVVSGSSPLANVAIVLTSTTVIGELQSSSTRRTTSDSEGKFTIAGVGSGRHQLRATLGDATETVEIRPGTGNPVRIDLSAP